MIQQELNGPKMLNEESGIPPEVYKRIIDEVPVSYIFSLIHVSCACFLFSEGMLIRDHICRSWKMIHWETVIRYLGFIIWASTIPISACRFSIAQRSTWHHYPRPLF